MSEDDKDIYDPITGNPKAGAIFYFKPMTADGGFEQTKYEDHPELVQGSPFLHA